jgi:hypothetical protein
VSEAIKGFLSYCTQDCLQRSKWGNREFREEAIVAVIHKMMDTLTRRLKEAYIYF